MPFLASGTYIMYSLDKACRTISILDPVRRVYGGSKEAQNWFYGTQIQKIGLAYHLAMEVVDPSWSDDLYDWKRNLISDLLKTNDR